MRVCLPRVTPRAPRAPLSHVMKRSRSGEALLATPASAAAPAGATPENADEAARASVCDALLASLDQLGAALAPLLASPPAGAAAVYDTVLSYARAPHEQYVRRYGGRVGIDVLLVGMNPGAHVTGPFGMCQSGVPFGDVPSVRNFLRITAPVGKPPREHPKRPVTGFACTRREVSGQRLWGWAARVAHDDPQRFFEHAFVMNYCPLAFMDANGANLTPDKLPSAYRKPLLEACDDTLRRTLALLRPRVAVGVGAFAATRLRACAPPEVRVASMPHPSPASPAANKDWAGQADAAMLAAGVDVSQWG